MSWLGRGISLSWMIDEATNDTLMQCMNVGYGSYDALLRHNILWPLSSHVESYTVHVLSQTQICLSHV
jgi:hypothetical protein